jgi:hypothetical protein
MFCASPINPTINPTVTVRDVATDALRRPRIKTRSIMAPRSGARIRTTTINAIQAGHPWWTTSSQ